MRLMVVLGVVCAACDGSDGGESCNGVDDNHDGVVDEGCPCVPFDITTPAVAQSISLASLGDGYMMVVGQNTQVSPTDNAIRIFDAGGAAVSDFPVLAMADGAIGRVSALAWTGSQLGVVVERSPGIALLRFDRHGAPLGTTELSSSGLAYWPLVTWTGTRFVAVWIDADLRLAEIEPDGALVGAVHEYREAEPGEIDAIVATPTRYAISYQDSRPYVAVIDRTALTVVDLAPSLGVSGDLVGLAAHGETFGLSHGAIAGADLFQGIDPMSMLTGYRTLPWAEGTLRLTSTATGFRLVGAFDTPEHHIAELDIAIDGTPVGTERPVATSHPALDTAVSANGGFAFAGVHTIPSTAAQLVQECD